MRRGREIERSPRGLRLGRVAASLLVMLLGGGWGTTALAAPAGWTGFALRQNDVVVFLGGANAVAAQHSGHLETLLTARYRALGVRFRSMAWEGDTVYAQPRDLNFPPLSQQLRRVGASVIFFQFGQTESFAGVAAVGKFKAAYAKLIRECRSSAHENVRLLLVTPPPFEMGGGALPDLTVRNDELRIYVEAIRTLAEEEKAILVDWFSPFVGPASDGQPRPRLTSNGFRLSAAGHAAVARVTAVQLGAGEVARQAGDVNERGEWLLGSFEQLRRAIVEKNRLWFDYWRPMNWAFLAGDRTEQPSSRDHRNMKVRWFPAELETFLPLIEKAEQTIEGLTDATVMK